MSMFTSPPSNPGVALLWGDRWWISGRSEPVVFGDIARAAEVLLAYLAEHGRPRRLRLLYQPSFFVSVVVACPHGNRATLQAALQDEHPALVGGDHAWGFEPIYQGGNATLLHYESEPVLFTVVDALRDGGIVVEGAWPLATALNVVPEDWPDTGAFTTVAAAKNRVVIYRHTPAGAREVQSAEGDQAAQLAATTVQKAFERDDATLYIVALDDAGARLALQVAGWVRPGRTDLMWPDLVRAALTLSLTQPNQLLPAASRICASRVVNGVTIVSLLTAGVLGAQIVRQTVTHNEDAARHTAEVTSLRSEVADLRGNETEIGQLRSRLTALAPPPARCVELLRVVNRKLPAQVVLTRIHADREGFALSGGVSASGLADADWLAWCGALQPTNAPWQLADVGPPPTNDFTLKGVWR